MRNGLLVRFLSKNEPVFPPTIALFLLFETNGGYGYYQISGNNTHFMQGVADTRDLAIETIQEAIVETGVFENLEEARNHMHMENCTIAENLVAFCRERLA